LSHLDPLQYPGWALSVELYIKAGIRGVEIGTVMFGYDPETQTESPANMDLVRLAMPRRVYTQSYVDYIIEAVDLVYRRRESIRGLKIVKAPPFLRHFTASFDWV
jgi:tyrosine phenol-lyase